MPDDLRPTANAPVEKQPLLDIDEAIAMGLLQEINRLMLHPMGLAIFVNVDQKGRKSLGGIFDSRTDPEGVYFAKMNPFEARLRADNITKIMAERAAVRLTKFGWVQQPPSDFGRSV